VSLDAEAPTRPAGRSDPGTLGSGPVSGPEPVRPTEAWGALGSGRAPAVTAVQLWLVELPFLRPVQTAGGTHRSRPLVVVQLLATLHGVPVEGWGECAALGDTSYHHEDVERSFAALEGSLVPALLDQASVDGNRLPPPSGMDAVRGSAPGASLAFAALEMAVADTHLRAGQRSLASLLGVEGQAVELGAVVGQLATIDAMVATVTSLVDDGVTRVKMKIGPGWDVDPVAAVVSAIPGLRLQVDANGSYARSDSDHLADLDRFELLCLEQPFDRDDLEGHARLAGRITTPICLDESVDSPESARRALAMGACSVVCVKPARLGGLGAALELVETCAAARVPLWMGGMFESGYARGVNATVAALPGFTWPGDLSPARWYLGDDLVPGLEPTRTGPDGGLVAAVPHGPGMGPAPDLGVLTRHMARHRRFEVAR
jgi:O-succinylbenzoate synthase